MTTQHQPDPEFQDRLEWQLRSELRRLEEFEVLANTGNPWWKKFKTAAVLILAVSLGAAGATAAEYYRDGWKADLLQARAETQLELARQRLEAYQQEYESIGVDSGKAARDPHAGFLLLELKETEHQFETARLELEEIQAGGSKPDQSLYADRVDGRDFVSEHLRLDRQRLQFRFELMAQHLEHLREGGESSGETELFAQEIANIQAEIKELDEKLRLRREFLNGEINALSAQLETELGETQRRYRELQERLSRLQWVGQSEETRVREDSAGDSQQRYLELELARLEAELLLAEKEIEILQRALAAAGRR